jgi:hypothetical protein
MTEKSKQIFKEEIIKTPKEWREAVGVIDWENISTEIGKKYLLDDVSIEDLQAEIALCLVSAEDISNLGVNIKYNVLINEENLSKIVNELFEKIFEPITKKIVENVKNKIKTKETTWEQNINFILSGGDYVNLLTPIEQTDKIAEKTAIKSIPVNYFAKERTDSLKATPLPIEKKDDSINNFTI